jgi:hypothetical protein
MEYQHAHHKVVSKANAEAAITRLSEARVIPYQAPCNNPIACVAGKASDLGGGIGNAYSQTVGDNVVNPVADALHDSPLHISFDLTVGLCGGGSFGLSKVVGELYGKSLQGGGQVCLVASTDGQLAVTTVEGGSYQWEAQAGPNAGIFATPDSGRIGDQEGDMEVVGVGGKFVGGGNVEISHGTGKCGNNVVNVQGGPGAGVGGKLGYGHTETQVWWKSKEDKPC